VRDKPQAHPHHPVDERNDDHEPRSVAAVQARGQTPQPEDDAAFVLVQNPDAHGRQSDQPNDHANDDRSERSHSGNPLPVAQNRVSYAEPEGFTLAGLDGRPSATLPVRS